MLSHLARGSTRARSQRFQQKWMPVLREEPRRIKAVPAKVDAGFA